MRTTSSCFSVALWLSSALALSFGMSLSWAQDKAPSDEPGREEKGEIGGHPEVLPDPIEGSRHLHFDFGKGMLPGGTLSAEPVEGEPHFYTIKSDILGSGMAVQTEDFLQVDLILESGHRIPMSFDFAAGGHTFVWQGFPGLMLPLAEYCDPIPAYPGTLLDIMWVPSKEKSEGPRFQLKRGVNLDLEIDWIQFLKLTITFGGVDSSGNPWSDTNPHDDLWPVTGNGGGDGRDSGPSDGEIQGDGSTVYVDSGADGQSSWGAAGTGGDNGHANWMDDRLGTDGNRAMMLRNARFIGGREARNGRRVTWVKFRFDFTTYLLVNREVVWKIKWHWEFFVDFRNRQVTSSGDVDSTQSASGMEPAHEAARTGFEGGSFLGAPCQ